MIADETSTIHSRHPRHKTVVAGIMLDVGGHVVSPVDLFLMSTKFIFIDYTSISLSLVTTHI